MNDYYKRVREAAFLKANRAPHDEYVTQRIEPSHQRAGSQNQAKSVIYRDISDIEINRFCI